MKKTLDDALRGLRDSGTFGAIGWLSVATSAKGSYNMQDVIRLLERHLQPWGPGRRWRILLADAYRPHMTPEVWMLCFSRGYVLLVIGGGCSGSVQVPDTHLHMPLSSGYQNSEMILLAALMEQRPTGLPTMDRGDCVRILANLYGQSHMHEKASVGFKHNYLSNALDGTEDHLGRSELSTLWRQLQMHQLRKQIIADVDSIPALVGEVSWTQDFVQSLIEPYELTKHLDVLEDGMDDEGEDEDAFNPKLWDDKWNEWKPNGEEDVVRPLEQPSALVDAAEVPAEVAAEAQEQVHRLSKLDAFVESAKDTNMVVCTRFAEHARAAELKRVSGRLQVDGRVAAEITKQRAEDDHRKAAMRAAAAHNDKLFDSIRDARAKLAVEKKQRDYHKQKAQGELEAKMKQEAVDRCALELDSRHFGNKWCKKEGGGKATKNAALECKWLAFSRIMALAPQLPLDRQVNLRRDWEQWDDYESDRHRDGAPSVYMRNMKKMLQWKTEGNIGALLRWWDKERLAKVPRAALVLPGMPGGGLAIAPAACCL